jgi:hypothetical protein
LVELRLAVSAQVRRRPRRSPVASDVDTVANDHERSVLARGVVEVRAYGGGAGGDRLASLGMLWSRS